MMRFFNGCAGLVIVVMVVMCDLCIVEWVFSTTNRPHDPVKTRSGRTPNLPTSGTIQYVLHSFIKSLTGLSMDFNVCTTESNRTSFYPE
jgi:hypothetical protein